MKYSVLDITPGRSLDSTLAEMAGRDGFEPIGIFFRAVAERRVALTIVFDHRFAWTPRLIKSKLPLIVVISDDFGESRDPSEWRCAISAIAWSRTAIAHGTGAQVEHYQPFLQPSSRGAACLSKRMPLMHPHGLPRSSRVKSHASYSVHRTGPSIRHRRKRHERARGASSRSSGTPPSALTMSKGQRRRV
jgi:hypothetical protein